MKKIFVRLKQLDARIAECEQEMQAIDKLPFYSLFSTEAQRRKDLDSLAGLKAGLLQQKLKVLNQLSCLARHEAKNIINIL
ncbi:hypothetical protein [Flavobacterium sp.]|uniref:hypothetical protein n=1 Tax=Flavobacterium sp. TaxID=239 RepID=UPI00260C8193|nr:hypothetical protein [Flavobacterium sp.]